MLADSKILSIFVFVSSNVGAVKPDYKGNFFAQDISGAAPPSEKVNAIGSPCVGTDNGTGGTVYLLPTIKTNVMSELRNPSESSQQPCPAKSIINKLLLTDDLDALRHRLSRDFMLLLTEQPDEIERNRIMSDFNTLDLILETLERER